MVLKAQNLNQLIRLFVLPGQYYAVSSSSQNTTSALILLFNSGIATYHVGVEQHWWIGPEGCTGPGGTPQTLDALRAQIAATPVIRCDDIAFSLFGISMAGYNVLFSLALAIYAALVSKAALRV